MVIAERPIILRHSPDHLLARMYEAEHQAERHRPSGAAYTCALGVCAVLTLAAIASIVYLLLTHAPRIDWGYAAAAAAFLVGSIQAAPVVAVIARLARGWWASPISRLCDLLGLAAVASTPLLLILLYLLPQWFGRESIWFDLVTAPQAPDVAAIVMLAAAGIGLIALSGTPRIRRWAGTPSNWERLLVAQVILGSLYTGMLLYVDFIVISDLGVSLVPGWDSAVMPVYQAFTGFEGALAVTILAAAAARRFGHLEGIITTDVFTSLAKLLLGFGLLYIWFFWSEFLTYWYGRLPNEKDVLRLFAFGPYIVPFAISVICCFFVPLTGLLWNHMRTSIRGVTIVAAIVLAGNYVDRVRLFVPAWSLAGPPAHALALPLPPLHVPGATDVLILLGAPAAVLAVILVAIRRLGPIAAWERQRDLLLRLDAPYLETTMPVLAKPN
jgi:molybdopterin-containing oxidoreductase family membrane subunit